jgi:hypothetical protein
MSAVRAKWSAKFFRRVARLSVSFPLGPDDDSRRSSVGKSWPYPAPLQSTRFRTDEENEKAKSGAVAKLGADLPGDAETSHSEFINN